MKYQFDKRFFNKLFFDIQKKQHEEYKRFVVNYGGAGSGKSHTQCQAEIINCLQQKTCLLVLRKFASTLRSSVELLFEEQLNNWGISYSKNKNERTIKFENGSVIKFSGLDDVNKLKSFVFTAGIRVWIEEADQITFEDFKQINIRVRGVFATKAVITFTFNPVSKKSWLYKYFFEQGERSDTHYFHTNYKDNAFLDEAYNQQLESYKTFDENMYKIYCLGEFGQIRTGTEAYLIKRDLNVSNDFKYDNKEPLYASFDENVHPHISVTFSQFKDGILYVVDELGERHKNLEQTCKIINNRYKEHIGGFIILGDPSSNKNDVKLEIGMNFFKLVTQYLTIPFIQTRVASKAQNVFLRILFCNKLLSEKKIMFTPNCKKTIEDLEEVRWDEDGTNKEKSYSVVNIEGEKIREQKNGHFSDSIDYTYCLIFKKELELFKNKGENYKVQMSFQSDNLDY